MDNTQFNELLKSPHLLASMPIEHLETLTKNYPWFSLAHSYLAKAYQENNSHKTSGQIALASTLHSNRTWLYGFLKEPVLQKQSSIEIIESLPTENIPEIIVDVTPSGASPSTSLAELAASMMEELEPEVREVKKREEVVRQEGRQEGKEVKRGEEEGRQEVRDLDFLDKSILAAAVSSSIFLEVSEDEDVEQDAMQDSAEDASQGPAEGGESEALFTWLRSVSDEERESERESERETTATVQPSVDLIEKFITTAPRITPGKVEQYTGISFAKESLEENFDWVTETMAKLYAAQGKIDRARKAYKRLIELHPEKKIHFENQLKVLNQRK